MKSGIKEGPWDLPVADASHLRSCLQWLKEYVEEGGDIEKGRRIFFSLALVGYYDAMWSGIKRNFGHVLYRLSDLLDADECGGIIIYPSSDGSVYDTEFEGRLDTLEDWRRKWKLANPVIPELNFTRRLETKRMLYLPETTA